MSPTTKLWSLCLALLFVETASAHAQLRPATWRGFLDVDVFNAGVVQEDPRGPAKNEKFTLVGFGPNQLGNSRAVIATPPVGLGFGYVLKPRWMLGLRAGLGYDRVSAHDSADLKIFGMSFMPEVSFVPLGATAKLFIKFSPIAQYDQVKLGGSRTHIFMGCFSLGAGTMIFLSDTSSIDIGAYFEGRFGKLKPSPVSGGSYVDVDDLRAVIRVGLSFWK